MNMKRVFTLALGVALLTLVSTGLAVAAESEQEQSATTTASQPESTTTQEATAVTDTGQQASETEEASVATETEEVAADTEEQTSESEAKVVVTTRQPPKTLQSLVDERRDALQRRREQYFDMISERHFFMPPWLAIEEKMSDDYRDQMRALYREHRDATRFFHDTYRGYHSPWSRGFRDWVETRNYVRQMADLDRQEFLDSFAFVPPIGPWGPIAYPWY